MLKFKYAKVAGQRMLHLTPERVPGMLRAMMKRSTWEGVIISPDAKPGPDGEGQFPVLSLAWHPGFGHEVLCLEQTGEDHLVATSRKLSAPEVHVELGGQGQELWPRELFVPHAIAEQAVLHVLKTGRRDPSLQWVGLGAFPRKNVRPRRRIPISKGVHGPS